MNQGPFECSDPTGFRRLFSRFDMLDVIFTAYIYFALAVEALRPFV